MITLARRHGGRSSRELGESLEAALHEGDGELAAHSEAVGRLARAVGQRLGLDHAELEDVERAGVLHDIGKVMIPEEILNKPEGLDAREWDLVRQHTIIGERLVRSAGPLAQAARMVRWSHERFDGRGYPDGISGDAIPLGARIISACDAYDAMVTDRPYRPALAQDEALAELLRCAGRQFDADVVAALCDEILGTEVRVAS